MSLKIALVGIGNVATGNYLPYLSKQQDIELGYLNRTRDKADEAARKFGGTVFVSAKELADWKPDSALILTSEKARYDVGCEVLNAGVKRAFFEKPLVAMRGQAHVSEDDFQKGKELLTLAEKHGCETAMMFNYRFFDQTLRAKQIVTERKFGQLINTMGTIHYACWSHCIDLVHHFGGNMIQIAALMGSTERHCPGIDASDVTASFEMENGATGTLIGTAGMKWQHPLFELVFTFENGRIHMRDIDGDLEVLDGASQTHERFTMVRDGSRWSHYGTSFEKALAAYLDSIRAGTPPPVPGRDGLRELQTEAALRRSIAEKRSVMIAQEFPL